MVGALAFGFVIGWVTHRTLRRQEKAHVGDVAAVIGAVGGAAVVRLFPSGTDLFTAYSIGLAGGFFGYLGIAWAMAPKGRRAESVGLWLGDSSQHTPPRP